MSKFYECEAGSGTGRILTWSSITRAKVMSSALQSVSAASTMLHQPAGSVYGPAADIAIEAREIIKMRERLNQIIATETGQSIERVRKDTERKY